jgi:hypothetical protein
LICHVQKDMDGFSFVVLAMSALYFKLWHKNLTWKLWRIYIKHNVTNFTIYQSPNVQWKNFRIHIKQIE